MRLGLSLLMILMESDLDIFEFLKEMDYDSEACEAAISQIKDLDVLDELVEHCYSRSQYAFRLATQKISDVKSGIDLNKPFEVETGVYV